MVYAACHTRLPLGAWIDRAPLARPVLYGRMVDPTLTRRQLLASGVAFGAGLALDPLLRRPQPGRLTDIDHVVIMIQENRSFDHYYGRFPGVRGFGDRAARGKLGQPDGSGHTVFPFHVSARRTGGGCTADPIHLWGPQHESELSPGSWVTSHRAFDRGDAPVSMAYFDRRDIPYHFALARTFTLCDGYFCSVMGPTDPNRSYAMTGTMDPDGNAGGPIFSGSIPLAPQFSWTTMPEQLEARGISWKFYSDPSSTFVDGDNTLLFFAPYHSNPTLHAKGIDPTFDDFFVDVAAGALPQVAWLNAPVTQLEHPLQSTPVRGEYALRRVVDALTARPEVWAHTVLFVTYDENGGFFDHVLPPTAPPGTPGEYLTVDPLPALAGGIAGPIGLGPRVPLLVISPFSRGGLVCSDVFDHTSLLRFLETRFGAEVPNLSAWRRTTCGDLTSALNLAAPNFAAPRLPHVPPPDGNGGCTDRLATYPRPRHPPSQPHRRRRRPSGPAPT
jgi:phospholipase C